MDDLSKRIKEVSSIKEISNVKQNDLFYQIAKSKRYDLLKDNSVRLDVNDFPSLTRLIALLLSNEDYLYDMRHEGFTFTDSELDVICELIIEKHGYGYEFDCFFRYFFKNKEVINNFIKEHEPIFIDCLNKKGDIPFHIKDCDNLVTIILKYKYYKLIGNIENYSISNLKLLLGTLKEGVKIAYYLGNKKFMEHIFSLKEHFEPNEFCDLLDLLKDEGSYGNTNKIIEENIDYLLDMVLKTGRVPKFLGESLYFRDECLKRNYYNIAVKCVLPTNIMQDEKLIKAYCKELNIDPKTFYERYKWLLKYYEMNNNIFNTFLGVSLKDGIFNLNKEHYERFINDIEIQMAIAKLDDLELTFFSKILDIYDYQDYDICPMIVNVIDNLHSYYELISSLDLDNLTNDDLRMLVSVLNVAHNPYKINDLTSLRRYHELKERMFISSFNDGNLNANKNNLLMMLFNIDLEEAKYIDFKYCHDNENNNILSYLQDSELPKEIYHYLALINGIIECDNNDYLDSIYHHLDESLIYKEEIPFESYLRSKYTELYSNSLYKIDERREVYGPSDSIYTETEYHNNKVKICIPRANFNFFIHCVGSCSLASDVIDTNYKNDWVDRPQLQDHFVACSYINEKGIYSLRAQGSIIFGFAKIDKGAILGMGNTDIDSMGRYAKIYNGSRELQEGNGNRARYYVPSMMLKTINNGYNEIVTERRNTDIINREEFKRKPDYIIMMAESGEPDNFTYLDDLYRNELSFIQEEDRESIKQIGNAKKLKDFLKKYKDIIQQNADFEGLSLKDMVNRYIDKIMKAKYYEDCLKAASDFDIPLVIIDRAYYFNKMLNESNKYDEKIASKAAEFYKEGTDGKKKDLFNAVAKGADLTKYLEPKEVSKDPNILLYM